MLKASNLKKLFSLISVSILFNTAQGSNFEDSTTPQGLSRGNYHSSGNLQAIDAVISQGSLPVLSSCPSGYKTSSGLDSYVKQTIPLIGFYSGSSLVKTKSGQISTPAYQTCSKIEQAYNTCPSNLSGSLSQIRNLYFSENSGYWDSGWSYSGSCSGTEYRAISCDSGYSGSRSQKRTVNYSYSSGFSYSPWADSVNSCVALVTSILENESVSCKVLTDYWGVGNAFIFYEVSARRQNNTLYMSIKHYLGGDIYNLSQNIFPIGHLAADLIDIPQSSLTYGFLTDQKLNIPRVYVTLSNRNFSAYTEGLRAGSYSQCNKTF